MKSEFIRARIEPHLKAEVNELLDEFGVTPTQVITMLYRLIKREHRIPFDLEMPNAQTARAIREARKKKGIVSCRNKDDLFKKLGL